MDQSSGGDKNRVNILIVMPSAHPQGGAELSLQHLLREEQKCVIWHLVFLEDGPLVQTVREMGYHVEVVDGRRLRNAWRTSRVIYAISRMVKSIQAVAVLGWMTKSHLYGGSAAWLAGVPAVWFQKGLPLSDAWMDRIAARIPAAGIFACSSFIARSQQALTPAVPIRSIHSAVDLKDFNPDRFVFPMVARQELGLPVTGPLIGIFGRLQHWKGMHVAIDAMREVLRRHPAANLVIVGGVWSQEPEYADKLREQADRLGLIKNVTFKGYVPASEIPFWMQACDVIVHASDREPFGIVILEAMALGKPVIAGSEGGPTEIINDGLDGLFAPFGDSKALGSAILRYLDDESWAHQVGQMARARAQQFSSKRFAGNVVRELSSIVGFELPADSSGPQLQLQGEPIGLNR